MHTLTLAFYGRRWLRDNRSELLSPAVIDRFVIELNHELEPFDVRVEVVEDSSVTLDIKGYGDLLNSVRIRAPFMGVGNRCLGHIIGPSKQLDLYQDIRRGVNRVLFAPETIEPEGSDKVVCHNCGCGC